MVDNTEKKEYRIGELSELLGMSARTIRYYEEIGLIDHPKRRGNKRAYAYEHFRRLRFIKRLKLLGLSLAEMSELQTIYKIHRSNEKMLLRLLELLDGHTVKIDESIKSLKNLKGEIASYSKRIQTKLDGIGK